LGLKTNRKHNEKTGVTSNVQYLVVLASLSVGILEKNSLKRREISNKKIEHLRIVNTFAGPCFWAWGSCWVLPFKDFIG
jgi:hypothetical protein